MPLSAISSSTWLPSRCARTRTSPPGRLNLIALLIRLVSTCTRRVRSARSGGSASASSTMTCTSFFSACDCISAAASATAAGSSTSASSTPCWPCSMRERSRMSLIRSSRCQHASWMWRVCAGSASVSPRSSAWLLSCAKPSTAFSGVRSSWLMRERNSLFAWLASSAAARARSASAMRSCSSAFTLASSSCAACMSARLGMRSTLGISGHSISAVTMEIEAVSVFTSTSSQ